MSNLSPNGQLLGNLEHTAAEIGKPFAMLLKAQYWHAAKRAQLFCEVPPSYVLPLTWRPDFLFKERNGKRARARSWMSCGACG